MSKIKTNEQRPFLTLDEASQYLGISKNTIYRYTSQGALIFYKLRNRKLYFKIDDLNEFVLNEISFQHFRPPLLPLILTLNNQKLFMYNLNYCKKLLNKAFFVRLINQKPKK